MKTRFVTDINKIKYEVNMEVARMAFNGELDEHREEIAYNIIPGNTPQSVSYTHLTLPTNREV